MHPPHNDRRTMAAQLPHKGRATAIHQLRNRCTIIAQVPCHPLVTVGQPPHHHRRTGVQSSRTPP
eukprot:9102329-Alexandrium_andersonii.AAC.1